ncbi:suppressor of fused domain protein [Haloferula chungangensis]|uniref:Suppressor of fused domain protein n=1 Tax=Haloferula chungangensis TaxID=1048331 RepID=A0ABW2L3Q8_9BACT
MLDIPATRARFDDWVRSPAFDAHFNSVVKPSVFPFIFGGLLLFSLIGIPLGLALIYRGFKKNRLRKEARRDATEAYTHHEVILCTVIIANQALLRKKGAVAPALLIGEFGASDEASLDACGEVALLLCEVYGEDPSQVAPELQEACRLVNDDTFRDSRRRPIPAHLSKGRQLWLFDTILQADSMPALQECPYIPCLAPPGPTGPIMQLPPEVLVFKPEQQVIRHKAPATPPPIVAPHSDNLEAVEQHIETHLGCPENVFHELISTTVHIDVHIVPATPERPWISLVTSGMSDIPMSTPEGAEEWRFAELMIRLPEGWPLDQASFEDERNYWPIRWLKQLSRFPHELETWIGYGHSIPNGDPPEAFAPGVPFSGIVLSPPWIGGEGFSTLYLNDGTPVHFWSLIPLHASEIEFKLAHGSEALFERIAAAGHSDLVDIQRPAVV